MHAIRIATYKFSIYEDIFIIFLIYSIIGNILILVLMHKIDTQEDLTTRLNYIQHKHRITRVKRIIFFAIVDIK